jgi:hypothetical protein
MKIDRSIFELNEVCSLSIAYIIKSINNMIIIKDDYEMRRNIVRQKGSLYLTELDKQYIDDLDSQLFYIELNLKTLKDALMIHESKLFEKRTSTLKELGLISLN